MVKIKFNNYEIDLEGEIEIFSEIKLKKGTYIFRCSDSYYKILLFDEKTGKLYIFSNDLFKIKKNILCSLAVVDTNKINAIHFKIDTKKIKEYNFEFQYILYITHNFNKIIKTVKSERLKFLI